MLDSPALVPIPMRLALLALAAVPLLYGCGLKGPLYIPTPEQERQMAERERALEERERREREQMRQPPPLPPSLQPPASPEPPVQPVPPQ
jgi:predicted small lipoprotein YifL